MSENGPASALKASTLTRIERFLILLERSLDHLPTSQRARLIEQTRQLIDEKAREGGDASALATLTELGAPAKWAAKLLQEHGLPAIPKRIPVLRWLLASGIGVTLVFVLLIAFAFWKFQPLVDFDETTGKIQFLGGWIEPDNFDSNYQFQSLQWDEESGQVFAEASVSGGKNLDGKDIEKILFSAKTADVELQRSADQVLRWRCRSKAIDESSSDRGAVTERGEQIHFQFDDVAATQCMIELPQGIPFEMSGENLRVAAKQLLNPLSIEAGYGDIAWQPDPGSAYRYQLSVANGHVDPFTDSTTNPSYLIQISLSSGEIRRQN